MNTKLKEGIAAGLTITLLVLLVATNIGSLLSPVGGIWNASTQASYPEYMEVTDSSLDGEVRVYRDLMGVPHIYASTEEDFAFAIGYIQAQDRLFQMEMQRMLVLGRSSELMAEQSLIDMDIEARRLGFGRTGELMYEEFCHQSDPLAVKMNRSLDRFCDGINRYIRDISPNKLPMEYLYLGIEPEPWSPVDICSLAKYMAYMLSYTTYDLQATVLADAFGKDIFNELVPIEPFSFETPVIPDFVNSADIGEPLVKGPISPESAAFLEKSALLAKLVLEEPMALESWFQQIGGCSNNWVVNGSLTTTGYPILCGDPHLMLMLPSIWWEFHFVNTITGESLYGVAFPGTPLCEIGANNFIGWSATVTAIDCVDFYVEKLSANGTQYLFNNTEWRKVETITETIYVANGTTYNLELNFTRHDYNPEDDYQCPILYSHQGNAVSVKWTGFDPDPGMLYTFYKMTHSRNITEFQDALRHFTVPGQNFVFGSVQGDIGMFPTAKYPVRNATGSIYDTEGHYKGIFLLNGSNGEDEWTGYIPFESIPQKMNPDQMYLASANQRTVNTSEYTSYYLSYAYADGYRGRAINRYLQDAELHSITVEDMQRLQFDVLDVGALEIVPHLLEAINTYYTEGISEPYLNQTVEALTAWNQSGTYAYHYQIAPTIWDEFLDWYVWETFNDEYSDAGVLGYIMPRLPTLENFTRFAPDAPWFNDTATPQTENASDIMLRALNQTIASLRANEKLGNDTSNWKWGNIHQMDIQYLMGVIPQFNIPKYPTSGNDRTINVAGGHNVQAGPSMRMVIDFSRLAVNDTSIGYLSYPGGQSGNPLSPHYRDSFDLWKDGQYHNILFPLSIEDYPTDYIEATVVFKP